MELKAGTLDDFNNSMAAAIESAFELVWHDRMGTPLPDETRDDRRMMFVAIAQGVIQHLKNNATDAFDLDVTVDQTSPSLIESDGDTDTANLHTHHITTVRQKNIPANKVTCQGQGKDKVIVNILTTGDLL